MTRWDLLATATLLLPLACGCGAPAVDSAAATTTADAPHELTPVQERFLKLGTVEEVDAPDLDGLVARIDLDDQRTARLNPVVGGRVAELLVQPGDRVAADQPLLALDSPEARAIVAESVRASADATLASSTAARVARLQAVGAVAEKDVIQAREEARKAEADLARTRAQLARLHIAAAEGDAAGRYLLRAPFAGTVVERHATLGMDVAAEAAEPLVVVSDLSTVRVEVQVPQRALGLVATGQPVSVHVDAYPDAFPGTVVAVGDVMDAGTQTVPVRCTVPNPDHRLKPAMFARVTVRGPAGRRLVAVPLTAITSDGEGFRVVARGADGRLAIRTVELGAEFGDRVQVVGGLAAGEQIVTDGAPFAARELGQS